jgi:hypothetical protein
VTPPVQWVQEARGLGDETVAVVLGQSQVDYHLNFVGVQCRLVVGYVQLVHLECRSYKPGKCALDETLQGQ